MSNKTKILDKKSNKAAEIDDHIRQNFDIMKRLGKGAYGIVWKAIDKRTQQTVAVKKIFDAFRNETDAQRTFREIMLLRALRNHPNIIQLYSIHRATNHMDIYLSFEFMESDLHNVIKRGSILKDIHKRYIMYQLLNATNFIHSGNIIHRDLKPSNILVDSKCRCKLADFGLARSLSLNFSMNDRCSNIDKISEPCLTDYVATRWYRAPEILIANKNYTKGIDMWSLGCILGEMCRGKPLFPGSCTMNQIECIISALPKPTESDIHSVGNGFGSILLNQSIKPNNSNPTLDELLADSPNDAMNLIKALLALDSNKRLTAKQALGHKYVEKFRNISNEWELASNIMPPFRDDIQLSVSEYRSKLYEIMSIAEKKKNSISTPPALTKMKIPSSESIKNSLPPKTKCRTILPKTAKTSTNDKGTKYSDDFSYLSDKCQQNAKYCHLSYSNNYNRKSLNNNVKVVSSTVQHQQRLHSSEPNDTFTHFSNESNNCKNCIQNTNDTGSTKSHKKSISMPKLKNDVKLQQTNHLNSNNRFEMDNSKHKNYTFDTKRFLISPPFECNSTNSSYKRAYETDARRRSLDDCTVNEITNQKHCRKCSPRQLKVSNSSIHPNGNANDSNFTTYIVKKTLPKGTNKKLVKQMSLDEYTSTTERLKNLEMKMKAYKFNGLNHINGRSSSGGSLLEQHLLLAHQPSNRFNLKSDLIARDKLHCIYPNIGVESINQNKTLRNSTFNGSYGIISAADLHKLRSTTKQFTKN